MIPMSFPDFFTTLSNTKKQFEYMCKDGVTEKDFDEIVVSLSNRPKSIVLLSATKASTFGKNDSKINNFS